ncbi:MAG: thermonuclease family protein, partial [Nitratireductor sp.]
MAKNYNRSNYRSNFRRVLDILVACVFLLAFAFGTAFITQYNEQGHFGPFIAVDGDTLLEGGNRLRLEGLDAPEYRQKCT